MSENQLTGSLPHNLLEVRQLLLSTNMLEGMVPELMSPHMLLLAISGQLGHTEGLRGPLPAVTGLVGCCWDAQQIPGQPTESSPLKLPAEGLGEKAQ